MRNARQWILLASKGCGNGCFGLVDSQRIAHLCDVGTKGIVSYANMPGESLLSSLSKLDNMRKATEVMIHKAFSNLAQWRDGRNLPAIAMASVVMVLLVIWVLVGAEGCHSYLDSNKLNTITFPRLQAKNEPICSTFSIQSLLVPNHEVSRSPLDRCLEPARICCGLYNPGKRHSITRGHKSRGEVCSARQYSR